MSRSLPTLSGSLPTFSAVCAIVMAGLLSGCGSSSSGPAKPVTAATTAAATTAAATTATTAQPPTARLHVLTPHNGAHTGSTIIVRVRVIGGGPGGRVLLYRLDHRAARRGGERLVLRRLNPGHHRLLITIDAGARVGAAVTFVVRRPAPAAPASTSAATATVPPAPTTAAPVPATMAAPAPTTTAAAPAPTTTSPPATAIPQGPHAGDQDGDNNGGPTDGDGNI